MQSMIFLAALQLWSLRSQQINHETVGGALSQMGFNWDSWVGLKHLSHKAKF